MGAQKKVYLQVICASLGYVCFFSHQYFNGFSVSSAGLLSTVETIGCCGSDLSEIPVTVMAGRFVHMLLSSASPLTHKHCSIGRVLWLRLLTPRG